MRIAFFSDIHADLPTLQAALAQIDRMGCDLIVCGGDVVGYDVFANECIALLRERRIPTVRGNHDHWAVRGQTGDAELGSDPMGLDLTRANLGWLARLPPVWRAEIDGVRVVVCHARLDSDMEGIDGTRVSLKGAAKLLDAAEADVLLVGHSHDAFLVELADGRVLANPGALWRGPPETERHTPYLLDPTTGKFAPATGGPTYGTFSVLDVAAREFTVFRASDGAEVTIVRRREPRSHAIAAQAAGSRSRTRARRA